MYNDVIHNNEIITIIRDSLEILEFQLKFDSIQNMHAETQFKLKSNFHRNQLNSNQSNTECFHCVFVVVFAIVLTIVIEH